MKGGKKIVSDEERKMMELLQNLADVAMDKITEVYAEKLKDLIIEKIDEIASECKEFSDRKNLLIVKLIDNLQGYVNEQVDDVKVE